MGCEQSNKCDNCGNVCSGLDDCWNACGKQQIGTTSDDGCTAQASANTFQDAVNLCKMWAWYHQGIDGTHHSNYATAAYGCYGSWKYRCCKIGDNTNGVCDGNIFVPVNPDTNNPNNNPEYIFMSNKIGEMDHVAGLAIILATIAILFWIIKFVAEFCKYLRRKASETKVIITSDHDEEEPLK